MYASVYVECHPSESPPWFTYMANAMDLHRRRCVAPLRALLSHLLHGDSCRGTLSMGTWRCALYTVPHLRMYAMSVQAHMHYVELGPPTQAACAMLRVPGRLYYEPFPKVSEFGDSHSAFWQVTGTVDKH